MKRYLLLLLTVLPLLACAQPLATLNVIERSSGRTLPVYWHEGRAWVAGEPGREYRLEIRNTAGADLLAVVSVDGVNVVTGETAHPSQSGYVIDAGAVQSIGGWRKSLAQTAAFYFTALPDSYAARTGRPDNVGVIGAALFQRSPMVYEYAQKTDELTRDAAAAPSSSSQRAAGAAQESQSLGTGHGRRESSDARHVSFDRATTEPEQRLAIYYDSYDNLVRRGVIPGGVKNPPEAFPGTFVPDPQ